MEDQEKTQDGQEKKMLDFIRKIPIFSDLSVDHAKRVLSRCRKLSLVERNILCSQGEPSDSLFILLTGKLAVRIKKSVTIATIYPVTSIGELGVFTGEHRSATVEAMEKSTLLRLEKSDIDQLIESDPALGVNLMRKVIKVLAERIAEDNVKIREFQNYIISQEDEKE